MHGTRFTGLCLALATTVWAGLGARSAAADVPTTTVITHGFQLFSTNKPDWMLAMGQQVLIAAGGQGAILRYIPADGSWQLAGGAPPVPGAPLVLLFNWADESDGASLPGTNVGYAEAAADALYTALRAPAGDLGFSPVAGRRVHVIGHSRGCCVNSEVVRRLGNADLPVDQMTNLDPHPVGPPMTESCGLSGGLDWGDTVPVRWSNVTWADNYWRKDTGLPGACHDCDFDGMALPAAQVYNVNLGGPLGEGASDLDDCLLGCRLEHIKTHVWYHGTIAGASTDSDCPVNPSGTWYANAEPGCTSWVCAGYVHSAVAGGPRPALAPGAELTPSELPFNGSFERSYSGWLFHGGGGTGTIVSDAGSSNRYLRLEPSKNSRIHNRLYLPAGASEVRLDWRVFTASTDDQLRVRLIGATGTVHQLPPLNLPVSGGWTRGVALPLDASLPRGAAYRLELAIVSQEGALTAVVGVDNVIIHAVETPRLVGDVNDDGVVNGADLGALLASWGPCSACAADLDGSGGVDGADLGALLAHWTSSTGG